MEMNRGKISETGVGAAAGLFSELAKAVLYDSFRAIQVTTRSAAISADALPLPSSSSSRLFSSLV